MKRNLITDILVFAIVIALLVFVNIPYLNTLLPFIVVLIYSYKFQGLKDALGFFKPKNILKLIGSALSLAVFIHLLSYFVLLPIIEKATGTPLSIGVFGQVKNNSTILITSLIISWIVGGLFEETIFRGFMISKFMKHINPKIGAVIGALFTSVLFGFMHFYQGITGQILLVITGLLLATIYVVSKRNLWLNILTHGFVNTISMFSLYYDLISFN